RGRALVPSGRVAAPAARASPDCEVLYGARDCNVKRGARDVADRRLELAALDAVRFVPEIRDFGKLSTERHDRPQRMDEPPGHAVDLKLAVCCRGDRAGEFAAGDGVTGKGEARERWERFAHGGKARKRGSEIGQIGPF